MSKRRVDVGLSVGLFMVAGIACLAYISIRIGRMEVIGSAGYQLYAKFTQTGGLKVGAPVVIAGVDVGRVRSVSLDNYEAHVVLDLRQEVRLQTDAIASVKTRGLVGEKYIEITPGSDEVFLKSGERIRETQPAVDIESLISKYAFGKL